MELCEKTQVCNSVWCYYHLCEKERKEYINNDLYKLLIKTGYEENGQLGDRDDFVLYMLLYNMSFIPREYKVEIILYLFKITKNTTM